MEHVIRVHLCNESQPHYTKRAYDTQFRNTKRTNDMQFHDGFPRCMLCAYTSSYTVIRDLLLLGQAVMLGVLCFVYLDVCTGL